MTRDEITEAAKILGQKSVELLGAEATELAFKAEPPDQFRIINNATHAMAMDGGEDSAKAKESIRQAVQHERKRLWRNQPAHPQAETEVGKTLQKQLRTTGPVANQYIQEMAHRLLSSMDDKSRTSRL